MAIDQVGFGRRIALSKSTKLKPSDVVSALLAHGSTPSTLLPFFSATSEEVLTRAAEAGTLRWERSAAWDQKATLYSGALAGKPFEDWLDLADRAEQVDQSKLYDPIWPAVNAHLGTSARSIPELVEQIGIARYGKRPVVGDAFCGGGSIPYEAARLGCDVIASDLNPIACMLTWGALNIVGADDVTRARIETAQKQIATAIDAEITELGIEHNARGDRAKAYLYCLETRCPKTGYLVPMLPSRVISRARRAVAVLTPDPATKRFDIRIELDAPDSEISAAETGTIDGRDLVVVIDGETFRTPIKTLRGDRRGPNGETLNALRRWEKSDYVPRPNDIFQERLYAIQWVTRETLGTTRQDTYFASVTADDLARERRVEALVRESLEGWQTQGFVPDMPIEAGAKTDEPIRTRGWTYWHHLFAARQLLLLALTGRWVRQLSDPILQGVVALELGKRLDNNSRLCSWTAASVSADGDQLNADRVSHVFINMALNPLSTYAVRSSIYQNEEPPKRSPVFCRSAQLITRACDDLEFDASIWITDPPYADAVRYEEITEYFIAWLRKDPPQPFRNWVWDSRRAVAIKGAGEQFKTEMVAAYKNLAAHMPDNGSQIVMFTHQDAEVWADMAAIMWGAGLQVAAAWYVATETTSAFKKGGYVQGTVLLVLRKRVEGKSGYQDEITLEIRDEVTRQIETLTGLNEQSLASGRSENLFEDADLQMAGYAAALRVLTAYSRIDGEDMAAYASRTRVRGRKDPVEEIIDFAADAANSQLVPAGLSHSVWADLKAEERFYLKMVDLEAAGLKKVDNYQNFAKAFRSDWQPLMASVEPNAARLKRSADFGKSQFGEGFGETSTRHVLWAILRLQDDGADGKAVLDELHAIPRYFEQRDNIKAIASYLAAKRSGAEGMAAKTLSDLIENELLG